MFSMTYPADAKVYLRALGTTYPHGSPQRAFAEALVRFCNSKEAKFSETQAKAVSDDILGLARVKPIHRKAEWVAAVYSMAAFINTCRG